MADYDRNQQEAELEIEQRVQEIARLIDGSAPERREGLREMVSSLLEQEVLGKTERTGEAEAPWLRKPMNPLALGLLFLILGVGLFFLLPPVGLVLAFGGILGIIWGVFSDLLPGKKAWRTKPAAQDTEGEQKARREDHRPPTTDQKEDQRTRGTTTQPH